MRKIFCNNVPGHFFLVQHLGDETKPYVQASGVGTIERVIAYFGMPERIFSDRDREFVGHVWDQLERVLGCTMIRTSPCHPQGNALEERAHRTINNLIRAMLA